MHRKLNSRGGFALPTVLIASVVMLIVLSVSVTSVATVRTALKTQYYEQLAKIAGESGVAYAKACLAKNGNKPLWTDAKPLQPSTDCAGNPLLSPKVQVLVVAGGGGGGNNHAGGGGGGGVVVENDFIVASGQAYTALVGAAGSAGSSSGAAGGKGGNSSFGSVKAAVGGGGGGGRIGVNSASSAGIGGSGGGGAGTIDGATSLPATGGSGTVGQGQNGGNGSSGATAGNGGGGGGAGGAGGVATGDAASNGVSGAGGSGYFSDISGQVLYYGGGGAGGRWSAGSVGAPGITGGGAGGDAISVVGKPGQINTGGGGGGGANGPASGGAGGSGVVYVRYANNGTITASGGSVTPYTSGPYKVHAFKTTGSSNLTVSSASNSSCPSDPRCSVLVNDTLRSSFSVTRPTLDATGRALTIPNNGYVELLRSSTGTVWRTYRQPAVQVAVVPDLCSGAAASALGWQNAAVSATQDVIPNASAAKTITLTDSDLSAGKTFYRKDFSVLEAGDYQLSALTTNATVVGETYIDGTFAITTQGSLANSSVNLSAGCHTLTVQLTSKTVAPQPARITVALWKNGVTPLVVTDSSWRASSGSTTSFSSPDFYADPDVWVPVVGYSATGQAILTNSTWTVATNDPYTAMISPPGNGCPSLCPFDSTAYMRDSNDFFLPDDTEVLVGAICDNKCTVYIDGEIVLNYDSWSDVIRQTLTVTAGYHRVGVQLYNGATITNPAAAGVTVVNKATGTVITRTDKSWQAGASWLPGLKGDVTSYENTFTPSPNEIPKSTTFDFLAIGGGGGGGSNAAGGGGAGGLIALDDVAANVGTYAITIGAGGAGAATYTANGAKGANTIFGSYTALGGGYGASRDGGASSSTGGSGGAGAGASSQYRVPGANGSPSQGSNGGNGITADAGVNATGGGGGGAGGPGMNAVSGAAAGNGGAGYISYLTGARLAVGGGGAGSITSLGTVGAATDGGGNGPAIAQLHGAANTGGAGGAGGNSTGYLGGNGGSGLVIVRVKTGSVNVSVTGSPITTTVNALDVNYTVYRFNASGSFRIISVN